MTLRSKLLTIRVSNSGRDPNGTWDSHVGSKVWLQSGKINHWLHPCLIYQLTDEGRDAIPRRIHTLTNLVNNILLCLQDTSVVAEIHVWNSRCGSWW